MLNHSKAIHHVERPLRERTLVQVFATKFSLQAQPLKQLSRIRDTRLGIIEPANSCPAYLCEISQVFTRSAADFQNAHARLHVAAEKAQHVADPDVELRWQPPTWLRVRTFPIGSRYFFAGHAVQCRPGPKPTASLQFPTYLTYTAKGVPGIP